MQKGEVLNQMIAKEVFFNMVDATQLDRSSRKFSLRGAFWQKSPIMHRKSDQSKSRFLADWAAAKSRIKNHKFLPIYRVIKELFWRRRRLKILKDFVDNFCNSEWTLWPFR